MRVSRYTTLGRLAGARGRGSRTSRPLAWAVALMTAAQCVSAVSAVHAAGAPSGRWSPPNSPAAKTVPVPGGPFRPDPLKAPADAGPHGALYRAPAVTLPAAGSTLVALNTSGRSPLSAAAGASAAPNLVKAGTTTLLYLGPATAGTPASVRVTYAGRAATAAAGLDGMLFGLSRADGVTTPGRVAVELDPSSLAGLYGGDFAQRLQLVRMPACALTTPSAAACRTRTPVAVGTDQASGRWLADVGLPAASSTSTRTAVAFGLTSVPAGSAGTYAATSLKSSDEWSAGGSTGNFTYSYPITVPPSLGGASPNVTLSYDSSGVDGQTVSSNAQSSEYGDGWSYSPGFIERSYQTCSQDGITNSADTCWALSGHEVSASGPGISGTLVWDDTAQKWVLGGGNASIQLQTGAPNGAYDGEYWVVTTTDGTRYYYGAGKLPNAEGGTGSDTATNSVLTEPVYCPNSGDGPVKDSCYSASTGTNSFASNLAYRWNLDFIVDPHGNTIEYSYGTETNYYERAYVQSNGNGTLTSYMRGGYLSQISYGWRSADIASEAGSPAPAAKVVFQNDERCTVSTTTCQYSNLAANPSDWPDVPYDQNCNAGSTTCTVPSMTYWTTKRVDQIQTQINTGTTSSPSYKAVDTFALAQSFPDPGDGTSPALRLDSVTRAGSDTSAGVQTGTPALPADTFIYNALPNRVPGSPDYPAFNRYRITAVDTEGGGVINVAYSTPDCNQTPGATDLPTPSSDNRLCYQQYWAPPKTGAPTADWFEKYVVTSVNQSDSTQLSPTQVISYTYPDPPAWHRDDSPLTQNSQRTWDRFRGYDKVITESGTAPDPVTESETTYLRGMNGDYTSQTGGTQRSVTETTTMGDTVTDSDQYAGQVLETQTFSAAGGTVQEDSESLPWSAQAGSHAETSPTGLPAKTAYFTGTGTGKARTLLSSGSWRTVKAVNVYSATTGRLQQEDQQGDQALVGTANSQETCTTLTYATPSSQNPLMTSRPARNVEVTVGTAGPVGTGACPAPTSANAVSDTLDYYDNATSPGVIASAGDATSVQTLASWTGATANYQNDVTGGTFDVYGRSKNSTSTLGEATTTAYTPATGTLPTSMTSTDTTHSWTTTTTLSQGRQLPIKVVDPNGETVNKKYDSLGRLIAVWQPGRAILQPASTKYVYTLPGFNPNGPSTAASTETETLRDDSTYATDFTIYDGFLQARQDQTVSLDGTNGSLVTDTFYDTGGRVVKTSDAYYITASPSATLYGAADANVPGQTVTTYDGRGRAIASAFYSYGNKQWQNATAYRGGDRTDSTPASGGSPTSVFIDALGRTAASWTFNAGSTPNDSETYTSGGAAPADATQLSYTYTPTPGGTIQTTTDSAGHVWTSTLNYAGHQVAATDPNAGSATATYDSAGDLLTVTSSASSTTAGATRTLAFKYDSLGRKTEEHSGSLSGPLVGKWTYDTATGGIGQPATSVSYDSSGNAYTQAVAGYTNQYRPTGESVTVPATSATDESKLAGTYSESMTYNPISGTLATTAYGADGGLPGETVTLSRDHDGVLTGVSGATGYLTSDTIDAWGNVTKSWMGAMPSQLVATTNVDVATGRPVETFLDKENGTSHVDDITTTWNAAGQITSAKDVQNGTSTDLQCYLYNTLGQLTTAWTDTAGTTTAASPSVANMGGCTSQTPSAATIGGPAPYWKSYTYDTAGDRSGETDHDLAGNTAADVVHTYAYPAATGTGGGPNQLSSVAAKVNGTVTGTDSYVYNVDGSVHSRTLASGPNESFTYDAAGRTASVTDATTGNSAAYRYDAGGGLLLERDTTAGTTSTTLYLPDEQITVNTGTQALQGLRYYPTGAITEVRTSSGTLTYEYGVSQGTQTVNVDAGTLAVSRRYFTPYGTARGTTPGSWTDNRGFLNAPADTGIGLDVLGQRLYDPSAGRFMQRDPMMQTADAAQLNGYGYASQDPVNGSDPTGTRTCVDSCGSEADQMASKAQREATYQADMQQLQNLENQAENQALDDCTRNSCFSRTIQLYNNTSYAENAAFRLQDQQLTGEANQTQWKAQFAKDAAAKAAECTGFFCGLVGIVASSLSTIASAVQVVAPILSAVAIATSFIPGLDAVTGAAALAVNILAWSADAVGAVSTVITGYTAYCDFRDHKSVLQTVLDTASAVAGVGGGVLSVGGKLGLASKLASRSDAAVAGLRSDAADAERAVGAARNAINSGSKTARAAAQNIMPNLRASAKASNVAYMSAKAAQERIPQTFETVNGSANIISTNISMVDDLYGSPDTAAYLNGPAQDMTMAW